MRKLVESTLVSLDGVIEAPERWSTFDDEAAQLSMQELNATLLGPDVVAAITDLKSQSGKDLIKYGTTGLDATLFGAQLVDELRVWVMPVVVGSGQRLFEGVEPSSLNLTLTDVRELGNGSVILTYIPE
jgi:dihydrofolate reductase